MVLIMEYSPPQFCDNRVQSLIMRLAGDAIDPLPFEREPHRKHRPARSKIAKGAIVIAAPPTHPIAVRIEGQQRKDHEVWIALRRSRRGSGQPGGVGNERPFGHAEHQRRIALDDHGQEDRDPGRAEAPGDRLGVDLETHRQIERRSPDSAERLRREMDRRPLARVRRGPGERRAMGPCDPS